MGVSVNESTERAPDGAAELLPPVIALLGPTAVGKSRHALELCRQFGGILLSADSRQVYRYMDIGTAKPTPAERASVSHRMIDLVEPSDVYSAQRFASEGRRVLAAAGVRGRPVFVVGGTGFYVSLLLDRRTLPAVAPNPVRRAALRREADRDGAAALHRRLEILDPRSAARIHRNNLPRIVRALEIVEESGRPVPPEPPTSEVPALYLGLRMDRRALHAVADRRVEEQVRQGLVDETEALLAMGYASTLPALDGLAYRQMVRFIRGEVPLEGAIAEYKTATHQYIRRQSTWFSRETRLEWIDVDVDTAARLHDRVARHLSTV